MSKNLQASANIDCNTVDYQALGQYGEYMNTFNPPEIQAKIIAMGRISGLIERETSKQKIRVYKQQYNRLRRDVNKLARQRNKVLKKYVKQYPASVCFRQAALATLFIQLPEVMDKVAKIFEAGFNASTKAKALKYMKDKGLNKDEINSVMKMFEEGKLSGTDKAASTGGTGPGSTNKFVPSYQGTGTVKVEASKTGFSIKNIPLLPLALGAGAAIYIFRR